MIYIQRAKKVVSDSPGLVDFAIGLVFFVLNLPDGQVLFFGEIQITEGLLSILPIKKGFGASWNDLWASTCYLQLARMAGCKTDFLCTLTSNQLFENQCNKICSYLSEKSSKGTFLKHEKLQNHSNEERGKEKKKEQGEGKEEKKKKAMVALLVFIIVTMEIPKIDRQRILYTQF